MPHPCVYFTADFRQASHCKILGQPLVAGRRSPFHGRRHRKLPRHRLSLGGNITFCFSHPPQQFLQPLPPYHPSDLRPLPVTEVEFRRRLLVFLDQFLLELLGANHPPPGHPIKVQGLPRWFILRKPPQILDILPPPGPGIGQFSGGFKSCRGRRPTRSFLRRGYPRTRSSIPHRFARTGLR
jgi:hypothetical protein